MKQFLSFLIHHIRAVLCASGAEEALRLVAEWCSWHPSPPVAFAGRLIIDLVAGEAVRLRVRLLVRIGWTRLRAATTRARRR
ncbi:hypothetical protein J5Y04_16590 [Kitasatospora sp. RG8]|uniref:hypothetical protein n=1 Tax=Kitasatospora sp. RG8 TaxID=2820815 RepID=UPI001ADF806C|nr:hypothetical protein [Kitasatospora sp. RG8]MBP0451146.1 hypothetical protein [Kitasatospora sp. RG8]